MEDDVRLWLVERTFDDKGLIRLVYATPDGASRLVRERSAARLADYDVTAAIEADPDDLDTVGDEETRERYATEVERVRERHDPDDEI